MSAFDFQRSGDRPPRFSKAPKPRELGWSVLAPLDDRDQHPCPICRHGQIQPMPMMEDAWACDFCRHLFTLDLQSRILRVEDSTQPLQWRWLGRSWQPVRYSNEALTPTIWLLAVILAIGPVGLIGLSQYLFPPLPGSRSVGFGQGWLISAAIGHFILAAWLVLEHYQWPLYVSLKLRWQDWRSNR
ncbi:hypothetical protein [Limnothrix redekei]|uniref:Uncharacterized protein n=1 Tax=Limnothrix redekei LRLZ20PSL1 TaxID=3112953 RepID=A0ABW7C723_9CYAN